MPANTRQTPDAGQIFLDHVGWFVPDMDAAARAFEKLGFGLTPFSIHGDRDPMIPIPAMFESAEGLAAAGHGALWHISYGVPHSIGQDGLDLGGDFLASCLKTQGLVTGA